jgi:hypothetical protein
VLDDIDSILEWVEESHPTKFDPDYDIGWIGFDSDPLVGVDIPPGMAHASASPVTCASTSTTIDFIVTKNK